MIRRFFLYQTILFFGLPIDSTLDSLIKKIDPEISSIFIGGIDSPYLSIIEHQGERFIGKYAGEIALLDELELLQTNIFSLLDKIFPEFSVIDRPSLQLIAANMS